MHQAGPIEKLGEALQRTTRSVLLAVPPSMRQLPQYWYWRAFLRRAQHWPRERIRAWQLQSLRAIVRHACETTEGYRELYREAGVSWRDLQRPEDVRSLPFTTKAMLQANVEAFSRKRIFRRYVTTGGSTGIPFGFYSLPEEGAVENAFMHEGWRRFGYRAGAASAVLRGAFIGSPTEKWSFDEFRRELRLSTYQLTPDTVGEYCARIDEQRITMLQAYPSALNMLCDFIAERRVVAPSLKLILLGSENVYDWQLAKYERTFPSAKIVAWYGHAERAILAPWCEASRRYHAWPFYGITELLDDQGREVGKGAEGELVGTAFHSAATPLIRYRTMDVAVKGESTCTGCAREFQLFDRIVGRLHEFIVTRGGRYISMTAINFHDEIFDDISQFQFFQAEPGVISLRYVPKPCFDASSLDRMRRGLLAKLGEDVELTFEAVHDIPRTASGKMRFLDQRLPIQYGDE